VSENKKSFWASVPGVITGMAGLLTGIVGLVTVLIQLDVIGGGDSNGAPAAGVSTTVAGQAPAGGGTNTTVGGRLTASPTRLTMRPTERDRTVTVQNSSTATVTVVKPELTGKDRTAFSTDTGCTNVALRPGGSCTVKVTLAPSGALRTYEATLVLEARELTQVTEVPIEATTVL